MENEWVILVDSPGRKMEITLLNLLHSLENVLLRKHRNERPSRMHLMLWKSDSWDSTRWNASTKHKSHFSCRRVPTASVGSRVERVSEGHNPRLSLCHTANAKRSTVQHLIWHANAHNTVPHPQSVLVLEKRSRKDHVCCVERAAHEVSKKH